MATRRRKRPSCAFDNFGGEREKIISSRLVFGLNVESINLPVLRNRSAILDAACAVVGAEAAFNYCKFTSIKKSQNFFQMRFIENLSFALKNGFKKFFSKVAV